MSTATVHMPAPTPRRVETLVEQHVRLIREAKTEKARATHLAYLSRFRDL